MDNTNKLVETRESKGKVYRLYSNRAECKYEIIVNNLNTNTIAFIENFPYRGPWYEEDSEKELVHAKTYLEALLVL